MRIDSVTYNNRTHAFTVSATGKQLAFPYAKADLVPSVEDPLVELWIDEEMGGEAFTYRLASGVEGTVHVEQVLEYNRDPGYMRELLLYQLTLQAQAALAASPLSKTEIARRLRTSQAQLGRLLDQTNKQKSVDGMLELLQVLDREVEISVRPKALSNA